MPLDPQQTEHSPPRGRISRWELALAAAVIALSAWLGVRRADDARLAASRAGAAAESAGDRASDPLSAAVAEAPGGRSSLVLVARDSEGAPVPRLRVTLVRSDGGGPVGEDDAALGARERRELELASEDGSYQVPDLPDGAWRLTIDGTPWRVTYPPEEHALSLPYNAAIRVLARPPGRGRARVVDGAARPIAGVAVRFEPRVGESAVAVTDEDGSASSGPLAEGPVVVTAMAGGVALRERAHCSEGAEFVALLRVPAGSLGGRVLAPSGAPISSAKVLVLDAAAPGAPLAEATTDDLGAFRFDDLRPGPVRVVVPALGAGAAEGEPLASASQTIADRRDAEVRLVVDADPRARVSGLLRWNAAPIPGAVLTFQPEPSALAAVAARTDGEGRFAALLEPRGPWVALAEVPGRGVIELARFEVEALRERRRDLTLPVERIAGRLVDRAGEGLAGATVVACLEAPWSGAPWCAAPPSARTAADGTFELAGLFPGEWTLFALPAAEGHAIVRSEPFDVRAGAPPRPIELTAPPSATLRIELAGAAFDIGEELHVEVRDAAGRAVAPRGVPCTGSAPSGLRVTGLAPGAYRVAVRSSVRCSAWSAPVDVAEGGEAVLSAELLPGGRLVVSVREPGGRGVPAAISLLDAAGLDVTTLAKPSAPGIGEFALGPLAAGVYTVAVHTADGGRERRKVEIVGGRSTIVEIPVSPSLGR